MIQTATADFLSNLPKKVIGVYCFKNLINDKRYVGSSGICVKGRRDGHLKDLRKKILLDRLLQSLRG